MKEVRLSRVRSRLVLGTALIIASITVTFTTMYFLAGPQDNSARVSTILSRQESLVSAVRYEALLLAQSRTENAFLARQEGINALLAELERSQTELRDYFQQNSDLQNSPLYFRIFGSIYGLDRQLDEWLKRTKQLGAIPYQRFSNSSSDFREIIKSRGGKLDLALRSTQEEWKNQKDQEKFATYWLFLTGGFFLAGVVLIIGWFFFRSSLAEMLAGLKTFDRKNQELGAATEKLEEKKSELEVQKLQLQAALDSVEEGVLIELKDSSQPIYNQKFVELLEIPDSVLLANDTERLRQFLQKDVTPGQTRQLSIGIPFDGDIHFEMALNSGTVLDTVSRPMELGGHQMGRVWSFRDISNHVADKQAFTEKIMNFQHILNSTAEGFIMVHPRRRSLYLNPAAEEIFGVHPHSSDPAQWPQHYGIYLPDRQTPCPLNELPMALSLQGVAADEKLLFIRNSRVTGGQLISVNGRPVYNRSGELLCGIVTFRKVQEEKVPAVKSSLQVVPEETVSLYLDVDLIVLPGYSPALSELLGCPEIAGRQFVDLLAAVPSNLDVAGAREYLEFCLQPDFSQDFVERLNPFKLLHFTNGGEWGSICEMSAVVERVWDGERIEKLKISFQVVAKGEEALVTAEDYPSRWAETGIGDLLKSDSMELDNTIQECAHSLAALQLFAQDEHFDQLIISDNQRFREYIDRLTANELMSQYDVMERDLQKLWECLEHVEARPEKAGELRAAFQETIGTLHQNLDEFSNLYRFVRENSSAALNQGDSRALLN